MNQDDDNFKLGRGLESLIPKSTGTKTIPEPSSQPISSPPQPSVSDASNKPAHSYQPTTPPANTFRPVVEPIGANTASPTHREEVLSHRNSTEPRALSHEESKPKTDLFAKAKAETQPPKLDAIFHIEVEKIFPNPQQPRRDFDEDGIRDLASSIREFGLLQPVVVTKVVKEVPGGTDVQYVLISGERRLRAAKYLGLERIPAIIRNVDLERERLELAIIENIQRENLNPIESARAMARLQDEFRLTQREIAVRLGKSREAIANTMRLLDLPMAIQEAIEQGKISESHGRVLLAVEEPSLQERLFRDLVDNNLTTRDLRLKVEAAKPKQKSLYEKKDLPPELKMAEERISSHLGAPVVIDQKGNSGKITISFYSEEELRSILDRLAKEKEY